MKDFRGVIVRRTMVQITGPGGVAETGQEIYAGFGGVFKTKEAKFVFPNKATIVCKGCEQEKDKYNFQGWQVSAFLVDEAQQMEESQVLYFISRMRTSAPMRPRMLMTANPDYNTYLRKWLEDAGYLDDNGFPRDDMDGVKTWFIRQGNTMVWSKSKAELLEKYGSDCGPMSFIFLPATCHDNPVLLERDPSYLYKLQNLPRVERERLLDGCWYAKEETISLWKREWVEEVDSMQILPASRVRNWDLACTLVNESNVNPDFTASVLMSRTSEGVYTIEDVFRFRGRHGDVLQKIIQTAIEDGPNVVQIVPKDPGVAGAAYAQSLVRAITEAGFPARAMPVAGRGSKLNRFAPFASACAAGLVKIVKRCCNDYENKVLNNNDTFYDELERFDNTRGVKDDMLDAASDAFTSLAKRQTIPNFLHGLQSSDSLLKTNNPFG